MMDGEFLFFAALFFKTEQEPFPGRIIVFDLQIHHGADPGESVSKDPEQSAIAEARVRGRVMKTHPNDQQGSRVTRFFF